MLELKENKGIPRYIVFMMAVLAGVSVANLYYNQPLLELIRTDFSVTEVQANLISVITQMGYATGLFLIIPMGDLYSRRKIILICMLSAALSSAVIGFSPYILLIWTASYFLGICSVIPQLFIPIAGQFSRPEHKSRNMGYVLSGLLIGILAARVVSGYVGDWLGWRAMFFIASLIMVISCLISIRMMPDMKPNFQGNYHSLICSILKITASHPSIRLNSIRASLGFGSMLAVWSCMAFHLAQPPFHAGSDMVGMLGACGIFGALAASGMGKYIPRYGVGHFSFAGAILQITGWICAFFFGDHYPGLVAAIILIDIGLQCQQLSNQSGCIQELPEASNRVNTIFMTTYFIGGSIGTLLAGWGWNLAGWIGVCIMGTAMAAVSLLITILNALRKYSKQA